MNLKIDRTLEGQPIQYPDLRDPEVVKQILADNAGGTP